MKQLLAVANGPEVGSNSPDTPTQDNNDFYEEQDIQQELGKGQAEGPMKINNNPGRFGKIIVLEGMSHCFFRVVGAKGTTKGL
jgi:hypothetical protein